MTRYISSALDYDWPANDRVATRELLLAVSMSDLAVTAEPANPKKIHKLDNKKVLYQISSPARARELARLLVDGVELPPILVQEIRLNHLLYYVVIDGNHRSAATAYIDQYKIKAQISCTTDVSNVPFILGPKNVVLARTSSKGRSKYCWKITGYTIETLAESVSFHIMQKLQKYTFIREKELAYHAEKKENKRNQARKRKRQVSD